MAILACMCVHSILGQSDNATIIESKLLGEERKIKVHLPQDYDEDELYPVIYMTDGETKNFDIARNYVDMLSLPDYDVIPRCILVGITQEDRFSELDPYRGPSGRNFRKFIFQELVPYIDSMYAASGFNVIIGHSDGAEFNQHILLEQSNPFRGFISISTNFNADVRDELSEFFDNYNKDLIYYFLANGKRDAYMRVDAGNEFDSIYKTSPNPRIKFKKESYNAGHRGLVPISLVDGLTHVFSDYNNLALYPTIKEYKENYLADLMKNYGIQGSYSFYDIDIYVTDILDNKKVKEFEYAVNLINENNLFLGRQLDPVNLGNSYFSMDMYPKTIEYFNKAIEDIENVGASFFYQNMHRAISAYEAEDRLADAIAFYEKSRKHLPEKYTLYINYRLAKFAIENKVEEPKGRKALEYCKANYRENKLFSMDDLVALEKE